jgi:hypothetical protein
VCLRIRTLAPHPDVRPGGYLRNGINLTDHPEPGGSRRPGRRPHVPSSKPTMSKSRHASSPGSIAPGIGLDRQSRGANEGRPTHGPPPLLGRHIWKPPRRVNSLRTISRSRPSQHCSETRLAGHPRWNLNIG